jgi:putative acetyltransferase
MELVIAPDDPRRDDIIEVLGAHLAYAHEHSTPEDVHALDVSALVDPAVSFFSARRDGVVLGVGALRRLEDGHVELKSMHTTAAARGRGVGRAMVDHLVTEARRQGMRRVSLETGTGSAFTPARTLYESAGFQPCEPFGDYPGPPTSICMTMALDVGEAQREQA